MTGAARKWQFWIDRGGTFTDVVARRPDGRLLTHKLLSRNPESYDDAVVQGVRDLLELEPEASLPAHSIEEIRVGTTVGTNALLEKQGAPTLLVITRGFRDLLRIGYQNRPDIFALDIRLPELLYGRVIEVEERLDAQGRVLVPLASDRLTAELRDAFAAGFRSCAVACLHSYRNPAHETAIGALARAIGFEQISLSHECSPGVKIVRRADTAVVDAYISPVLDSYVDRLQRELAGVRLRFMQSGGGLAAGEFFRGRDSLLSGPAGGVIGAVRTAARAGYDRVIGFDMGGTSTDVSHYAGAVERRHESEIAGVRLQIPMLHIETVAAGGGSILEFDGERFRVGPRSAGADPGPACYRRGGPLTVTDANLLLGRIRPENFPPIFGPGRDLPLDAAVVHAKFAELARELKAAGIDKAAEEIAAGFFLIANENMARAIKKISVQKGRDLALYTLNCFGGAGGQHACALADSLGIRRVLSHPCAGVLSAYGIGLADVRRTRAARLEIDLEDPACAERLAETRAELEAAGLADLNAQAVPEEAVRFEASALLRYAGSDTHLELRLKAGDPQTLRAAFTATHRERFGFVQEERIIIKEISVIAVGETPPPANGTASPKPGAGAHTAAPAATPANTTDARLFVGGVWRETPVYRRENLPADFQAAGPLIVAGATDTTVVDPGWAARLDDEGVLILERQDETRTGRITGAEPAAGPAPAQKTARSADPDPIRLEIYNNTFQSIADEMGLILQSTASSVNIKERLDFSCALFDAAGDLVASAPHIPVHLGSMSDAVRSIRAKFAAADATESFRPGDVFVTNNPYAGGTHLPDVTVITPYFYEERLAFYLAARGHHADLGGISPGSMPAHSRRLEEEGVLLDNLPLVQGGRLLEKEIRAQLGAGDFPARNPDQNLADLRAQIAANRRGVGLLDGLLAERGLAEVTAYTRHIQDNAARAVARLVAEIRDGENELQLDDDSRLCVRITRTNGAATGTDPDADPAAKLLRIDFRGSSPMSPGNLNAPAAVVRSAVLYVMRTLIRDTIPLNEGCLRPLELILPAASLLSPTYPAAVVGGNVETSQIIVDALLGALGALAGSQGTMNNLTFGNDRYQYYETICGGTGAGRDFAGASGVHSHMTNSRLTDPEVLEARFPVLLVEFALRADSAGRGRHPGGEGVRRRLRFLEAMRVSLLTGRRRFAPPGLAGGGDGATGENRLLRGAGRSSGRAGSARINSDEGDERDFWNLPARIETLAFRDEVDVVAGDDILILTPGGGGFGE